MFNLSEYIELKLFDSLHPTMYIVSTFLASNISSLVLYSFSTEIIILKLPCKTERRFWAEFRLFSAHFPPIFRRWYPIPRFSAHMLMDSDYFPPNLPLFFRQSCLAGYMPYSISKRNVWNFHYWKRQM